MAEQPLTKELREGLDAMPDKFTLAWWKEQHRDLKKVLQGAIYAINRCIADYAELYEAIGKVQKQCDSVTREREEANAQLGKLRAEFVALKERQDKMAEWIKANVPRKENAK